jgi:hypothetical protein
MVRTFITAPTTSSSFFPSIFSPTLISLLVRRSGRPLQAGTMAATLFHHTVCSAMNYLHQGNVQFLYLPPGACRPRYKNVPFFRSAMPYPDTSNRLTKYRTRKSLTQVKCHKLSAFSNLIRTILHFTLTSFQIVFRSHVFEFRPVHWGVKCAYSVPPQKSGKYLKMFGLNFLPVTKLFIIFGSGYNPCHIFSSHNLH